MRNIADKNQPLKVEASAGCSGVHHYQGFLLPPFADLEATSTETHRTSTIDVTSFLDHFTPLP